jgi:hypothetical protein
MVILQPPSMMISVWSPFDRGMLARLMKDTKYPLQLGDIDHLNKVGMELMRMMGTDVANHYLLASCDEETKRWKTFRDGDPSPFRSLITGMGSVPLKGKWMEIDDDGNPPAPAMRTENSMMWTIQNMLNLTEESNISRIT